MKKNTCQFCGIENSKINETWINHKHFGLICNECIKSKFVKNLLSKYKNKD